jgi:hypothetical protein
LAGESQARNPKSRVKASQSPLNRHTGLVSASSFCRTVDISDAGTRSTWPVLIAEATAIRSHPARAAWPDCAVETHKMGLWRIVAGMGLCIGDAGQWHQLIAAAASAGAVNSAPGSYIMFSPPE